jgi:tetratricopeptide (TPR) repeat protein
MSPLPYPHRVSFLAAAMNVPEAAHALAIAYAKVLGAVTFDHLVRHPIVSVGDFDDEQMADADGHLLDARHPDVEETIDWFFHVARRHEVLWLDVALDGRAPTRLRSRLPQGPIEEWVATGGELSQQLAECLDRWLDARRLPRAGAMTPFTLADLHAAVAQLDRAVTAGRAGAIPPALATPPPRLSVAFLRALASLGRVDTAELDRQILRLEPTHPVARRNQVMASLREKGGDRRAMLPIVADAPMYGKPHLSVWGETFDDDRPDENMGLRHQGLAASLIPSNPYACHNYSLQLNDEYRREESFRWADRATIASPSFDSAHLDCVRRLRQVFRPGQAFAEAQYRCNDILARWRDGQLPRRDAARVHAGLLLAFTHYDIGRLDEALRIADDTLRELDDAQRADFAWASARTAQWRSDAAILAAAYAWEGANRGDPGRVLTGFGKGRVQDADDVVMLLDALIAVGREDLGLLAFQQYLGAGIVGDGKARLAGAKLHILGGDLDEAIEQILIVELRRSQSRLESEINRVLRLACVRSSDEWNEVIAKLVDRGARRLARMAARDLADFVPGMDASTCARAAGGRDEWSLDEAWLGALRAALPKLGGSADAIGTRLADPHDHTLGAADVLAQEWWTVLTPPNKDRDAHAAGALYALGVALARYLALASGPPTPLAGAYRHVATEALHLARRARYQIEERGVRALLELVEKCAAAGSPEWLVDTWLLRVERALDLDAEYGAHLPRLTGGLPRVGGLLRGDERIGWELRLAWDLRADAATHEPARLLFERGQRAIETGAAAAEWSNVAAESMPPAEAIDVHWVAAIANPGNRGEPWVNLARAQLALGKGADAFESLCRAFPSTPTEWRAKTIESFRAAWPKSGIDVPFSFEEAQAVGLAALHQGELAGAARCMRWCAAHDPRNAVIKRNLGIIHARAGDIHRAIRAFAGADRHEAAKLTGAALLEAKQYGQAVLAYRLAALRFKDSGPEAAADWRLLGVAAWYAEDDARAAQAYAKMVATGATDAPTLHAYATSLNNLGRWRACEPIARQLISAAAGDATYRSCGLHALARALCGLGRYAEAVGPADEAVRTNPLPDNAAEFADTLACARAQRTPTAKPSAEDSVERQAWDALAAGDVTTPEQLAAAGNSWGLFRSALAAAELRGEHENNVPASGRALEGARMVLDRTIGNPLPDAVLARIRALRIRENAFIQIDPPPPLGGRLTPADFAAKHAQRVNEQANAERAAHDTLRDSA